MWFTLRIPSLSYLVASLHKLPYMYFRYRRARYQCHLLNSHLPRLRPLQQSESFSIPPTIRREFIKTRDRYIFGDLCNKTINNWNEMKSFYENNIFGVSKQVVSKRIWGYTCDKSFLLGRITQPLCDVSMTRFAASVPVRGTGDGLADRFGDTNFVCLIQHLS